MSPPDIAATFARLLAEWENECVEFKEANDNFPTPDIGKYFSALSNEANLRNRASGWLVFGVRNKDRAIVGTTYREDPARLHSLKKQIADGTDPSITFREIHEITVPASAAAPAPAPQGPKRVLLFEIPAAPRGMPIGWNGHCFARANESLAALDFAKLDALRAQSRGEDWSAVICEKATLASLDPAALAKARDVFVNKFSERIPETEIRSWDDATFLDRAKITSESKITRATLLLLGRNESTHHISPHVAEMTWRLDGEEQAYEHFHPPFLLTTTQLYQRIRNIKLTLLPIGQMIPIEIPKYDQRIVLEALHNCIAHQDYRQCERILVIERPGELLFQNAGDFYDGKPEDYLLANRTPTRYRNRFLAEAMANLRMIDTMGFGIRQVMFAGQARRFLPLPELDLTHPNHVQLRLPGRILDENYSRLLQAQPNLDFNDILALDSIQKGTLPADETSLRALRLHGLVEGKKPRLRIAARLAADPEAKSDYLRHRAFDDDYFCKLIIEYLTIFGSGTRADFRRLLAGKLSSALNETQKEMKVRNLLQKLRMEKKVTTVGLSKLTKWVLSKPAKPRKPI